MQLITDDGIKVEWVDLGEGRSGDYDPGDPDDVALLRFDVCLDPYLAAEHHINGELSWEGAWVTPQDASYCTNTPTDTNEQDLAALLGLIATRVRDGLGTSLKRTCEELSWIEPGWLQRKGTA